MQSEDLTEGEDGLALERSVLDGHNCPRDEQLDNGDWYGKSWDGIYVDTEVNCQGWPA